MSQTNIIINGSLEPLHDSIIDIWDHNQPDILNYAYGKHWFQYSPTVDLYCTCFTDSQYSNYIASWPGFQSAKDGKGYIGELLSFQSNLNIGSEREYFGYSFGYALDTNALYFVQFSFNLANASPQAVTRIGLKLLPDSFSFQPQYHYYTIPSIYADTNICYIDTLNWIDCKGAYKANGTERYFMVGNFYPDSLSGLQQVEPPYPISPSSIYFSDYYFDDFRMYKLKPYLGNDTILCLPPNGYVLQAHEGFTSYLWSTGDTTAGITITQSGSYWCTGSYEGVNVSDTINITFYNSPSLDLQNNILHIADGQIQITANTGYASYKWNTGAETNSVIVTEPGLYIVTATTADGCIMSDSISVSNEMLLLQIPSLLQSGESLLIHNLPANSSLFIYDAIGQIVYKTGNYQNNWYPVWANAMYYIHLKTDKREYYGKLEVVK